MIRLTFNAQSDPEIHLFNKSTILLGAESAHVDLLLLGSEIQPIHLKIIEQNGFPILINCANDPFASVNGHPFGKKLLNSGDIIVVQQNTILFETLINPNDSIVQCSKQESSPSLLQNHINKQEEIKQEKVIQQTTPTSENICFTSFSLPFEKEVEVLKDDEIEKDALEIYLKELSSISEASKQAPPIEEAQIEEKKTTSLKDDYLRELDDDNQEGAAPFRNSTEPSHLYQAWKWILLFIFTLFAISGAIGSIIYFNVSDKTEAHETKAAQGVADVAIALTFAQLNHLKPHNQNWSDIDFLKSNLQAILPEIFSYATHIDSQGRFNCCPYNLRIYTSSDLTHFLLIAQPDPTFLYWLVPQPIIVVDSHMMELRILKDVRSLNRLLANAEPLDGLNGKEITNLVRQGGIIRLSSLAGDSGHLDFAPPKNLGWIQPGAENLIYNSPRYYRLGKNLLQKAINLSTSKGSSQEVAFLKQDVANYNSLNHYILYSDQGKKSALLARQSLLMFAPTDKLLFGYLLFNAHGKIHQVHLLKDEEEWKDSSLINLTKEKDEEIVAFQSASESETKDDFSKNNSENFAIDQNHPIYIQLQSLILARENELKPLITSLNTLMNQELQIPRLQYEMEFQNLSQSYLNTNAKHKQALKENLEAFYEQYEDLSIQQFLAYLKGLHLEHLIQQEDQSLSVLDENCQQNMETLLTQIENSKSLSELDNFIHIATSWLNFDYIKDSHELMKYQNLLRNQLLEQLNGYLLSQKKHYIVKIDDKKVLQNILNQERLINPEERDFFLSEFEELLHASSSHLSPPSQ